MKITKRGWIYTILKNESICIYADIYVSRDGIAYSKLNDKGKVEEEGFLPFSSILKIQWKGGEK